MQNFPMFKGTVSRENEFSDFAAILAKAEQQQPDRDIEIEEQMPGVVTFPSHFKLSFSKIFYN